MRSKLFILFLLITLSSMAQRRITPVDPTVNPDTVVIQTDSTEMQQPEKPKIKGYLYPLLNGKSHCNIKC